MAKIKTSVPLDAKVGTTLTFSGQAVRHPDGTFVKVEEIGLGKSYEIELGSFKLTKAIEKKG